MIEIRKKPTEMRYCFVVIRGEMNKVMIIEKQRFGRGLIREISKYVCTLYAYYSWRCSNTFYAYYYLSYEVNRICSAICYTNKKNQLKLTESIFYTLSICFFDTFKLFRSSTSSLEANITAFLLENRGFHPNFFNFDISRCIYFTSPIQPLPSLETGPCVTNSTLPRFIVLQTILAIEITSSLSSLPTLNISILSLTCICVRQEKKLSIQSSICIYDFDCNPFPMISNRLLLFCSFLIKSHMTPCLLLDPITLASLKMYPLMP